MAGDDVITPPDRVSTLNMIVLLGANPVMIDVDKDTLMVTPDAVDAAITPRTKAIIRCITPVRRVILMLSARWGTSRYSGD